MRLNYLAVPLAVAIAAACIDQDERHSIDLLNDGIDSFDVGEESRAIEALEESTHYDPTNHRAWYVLGQVHNVRGEWEEAAAALSEAVKYEDQDPMYQFQLGEALVESGQYDLAETHLDQALELNDRLFRAWYFLGRVYDRTARPDEAAAAWTRAAELNPYYGPAFVELGRLYLRWDMIDEAISVLEQGSMHVRGEDDLSDLYYFLGLAYESNQQRDEAVEAFSEALAVRAGNEEARLQRGFVYADMGELEKAKDDLTEFVDRGGGGVEFNLQVANTRLQRLRARQ